MLQHPAKHSLSGYDLIMTKQAIRANELDGSVGSDGLAADPTNDINSRFIRISTISNWSYWSY